MTPGERREYACVAEGCAGVVASSAVRHGVIDGVMCPACGLKQRVYLGGYRPQGAPRRAGNADPNNPPIEHSPVRPWRRHSF